MKSRSRVHRRIDHRIFAKTARRTHKLNIPGRVMQTGGTKL